MEGGPILNQEESPPSYESHVVPVPDYADQDPVSPPHAHDGTDQPPTYDSLFGKVKEAHKESSGTVEFFKKVFVMFIGTVGFTICLALVLALPITMVVIGAIYKNDCPIEHYIPIYLIVAGSFGIFKNLISLGQRFRNRGDEDADEKNAKPNPLDMLINCFLLAWFIAGNVWIYGVHKQWTADSTSPNYCHPTLYYFAFWITTATYIIMAATCCCVCCGGILTAAFGAKSK
ncbi:hypothetical protein ScPMuIL_009903 [Solemya velum]